MKKVVLILLISAGYMFNFNIAAEESPKAKWQKVPLRFQKNENLSTKGNMIRLRREFKQEVGKPIVFEAEEATILEFKNNDQKISKDGNASGGHYIEHVKMMEYEFEVMDPGKYQVRFLAFFPLKANYNHRECIDDGKSEMVVDSNKEPAKMWRWTRGNVYDLSKGKHRYIFPSPFAFCGGAKLDKIVFVPEKGVDPQKLGPDASPIVSSLEGEAVTRRIKLKKIKEWRLDFEAEDNGGQVTVEYSYDKSKGWSPVTAGKEMKVPLPKPTYIYFKFKINGKKGTLSPCLQNTRFMIIKE
jgi:hypothetical protein